MLHLGTEINPNVVDRYLTDQLSKFNFIPMSRARKREKLRLRWDQFDFIFLAVMISNCCKEVKIVDGIGNMNYIIRLA